MTAIYIGYFTALLTISALFFKECCTVWGYYKSGLIRSFPDKAYFVYLTAAFIAVILMGTLGF